MSSRRACSRISCEDLGSSQLDGIPGAVIQGVGEEDPEARRAESHDTCLQAHDEFLRVDVECDLAGAAEDLRE